MRTRHGGPAYISRYSVLYNMRQRKKKYTTCQAYIFTTCVQFFCASAQKLCAPVRLVPYTGRRDAGAPGQLSRTTRTPVHAVHYVHPDHPYTVRTTPYTPYSPRTARTARTYPYTLVHGTPARSRRGLRTPDLIFVNLRSYSFIK